MKHTIKERGVYCWVIIVFVMFCIHCYQIGQIPCGINVDEMGMGYDAHLFVLHLCIFWGFLLQY